VVDQKLISAAIWIAGLILVPIALTNALEGNPLYLLVIGGFSFILYVFFVLKDAACALPLLGACFVGKLNFLPFGLTAPAILTIALIVYFFFAYFALKQRSLSSGPMTLFVPILVITAIIAYHNRKVGLHALGSSAEGSAMGLIMLLGSIAYICGASMSSPSNAFWIRLPWYCTLMGIVSNIPNVLSTYFPNLTPYLYQLTDAVNVDAYRESLGMDVDVTRGGLAGVGSFMEVYLLAYYPIHTWWRPHRWWVPIALMVCLVFAVSGGFRSIVALFSLVLLLAMWCYYSWRSLFLLPVTLAVAYGLSLCAQSGLVELPMNVQRSLSFLPGNWDSTAVDSATASNEFRQNITTVYWREELYKSPWIGNGFIFDTKASDMYVDMARKADTFDHYYTAKAFISSKTYHVGWISLYDMVGLIGGAAFIALGANMIWMTFCFVSNQVDHRSPFFPLKVWLFCNIAHEFVSYFTLFGDIRYTFPTVCAYAIILVHLDRMERAGNPKTVLLSLQKRKDIQNPGRLVPQPSFLRPG
jgi:hypothetical protein